MAVMEGGEKFLLEMGKPGMGGGGGGGGGVGFIMDGMGNFLSLFT